MAFKVGDPAQLPPHPVKGTIIKVRPVTDEKTGDVVQKFYTLQWKEGEITHSREFAEDQLEAPQ